jgi:hypothetical protein
MTIVLWSFNPADWYWLASDGRVYSSKRNALVYSYDSPYMAFVAAKGAASPWPVDANGQQTTAALGAVLAAYGITIAIP